MAAIKTQTVPALDRALSILELLAKSRAGLTLPELVKQSALPRSSVHYLLVTLERRGYVQRNERTSRFARSGRRRTRRKTHLCWLLPIFARVTRPRAGRCRTGSPRRWSTRRRTDRRMRRCPRRRWP